MWAVATGISSMSSCKREHTFYTDVRGCVYISLPKPERHTGRI